MALAHSPSIVTNGLVLVYDMSNTGRSWKGAPTTNLVPNPYANWNGSSFVFGGYNYDATGTQTYTYVTNVSNPIGSPAVMQYTTGTTGYKYWAVQGTVATTGTHTFSYYARIISGPTATSNLSNSQLWRSNGVDQAVTGDWNPTYTTEWVRYSTTGPCTAGTVLDYFPIHSGGLTGGYTIQYCGFQLELGTYATPFVPGTRSNTQALLDPTGQDIITATSLTYPSDGSFSFNGSNNYLTVSTFATKPTTAITCESWIRPTKPTVTGTIRGGSISSTNSMYLGIIDSTDGGVTFSLHWANQTSVSRVASYNGSVPNNAWSHIVGTYDGSIMRAYLNGVQIYSEAQTGTIPDATYVLGTYGLGLTDGVHNFNGLLPLSRIYNRALTATEVMQNFNALRGRYGV
jgi:hypothetical protein